MSLDESRRRRGSAAAAQDVEIPWRQVAATPRQANSTPDRRPEPAPVSSRSENAAKSRRACVSDEAVGWAYPGAIAGPAQIDPHGVEDASISQRA